jgi:hypothetical protein
MGILDYMWVFSLLNACFTAIKTLLSSISKYRSYNRLMKKFDRLFRRSTSAPDQTCTICLSELLNCRQLAACGHYFHYRCLFQWMQTKMECPICRAPIQLSWIDCTAILSSIYLTMYEKILLILMKAYLISFLDKRGKLRDIFNIEDLIFLFL